MRALFRSLCAAAALAAPSVGAATGADPEGLECFAPPFDASASQRAQEIRALVGWLRAALAPFGGLGRVLAESPPEFCLATRLFGAQGYVDASAGRIVLREDLPPSLMRAVAIHELRHVEQVRRGSCPSEGLSMEATGRVVMAMEADASAVSLAVAWSLREAGDHGVWTALADWDTQAALARAFEAEMQESGDVARATATAFTAWYENAALAERYYVAACSSYLDRQEESHALPRYGAMGEAFFADLCRLPGGGTYPCREPDGTRN